MEARSCWMVIVVLLLGCGSTEVIDGTTSSTGDAEVTESTGAQWPEVCDEMLAQAECDALGGQYGCMWVDILSLEIGADACATTVLRSQCVAFENQGNGCSYGPRPASCGEDFDPPHWYRDGVDGVEYVADRCERLPVGWLQCWEQVGDPPECECVCLDAD